MTNRHFYRKSYSLMPGLRVIRALEHMIEWYGKPTQNSYIVRFNRIYRTEILDMYVFRTLNDVRDLT